VVEKQDHFLETYLFYMYKYITALNVAVCKMDLYDESIYTPDGEAVVSTVGGAVETTVLGDTVDPDTLEVGSITEIRKKNPKKFVI
jgi:hypothetical protein